MSKRRAVILSVTIEGRSQAETARLYNVSESFVSRLLARNRTESDAAFEPRTRRPHNSPTRVSDDTVELITNLRQQFVASGLDAGAETVAWHLQTHHRIRRDRIDKTGAVSLRRAGQMHHISIGRAHAGTPSCCSSPTSTSESSRRLPENSSAASHSTPPAATNPAKNDQGPNPLQVRSLPMSRDITLVAGVGLEPTTFGL